MQAVIVALIVGACGLYAAWTLMPAAARRALATALLKLPLPGGLAARLRRAATASSGCGCDGCDAAPMKPAVQPVTFHRRPPR